MVAAGDRGGKHNGSGDDGGGRGHLTPHLGPHDPSGVTTLDGDNGAGQDHPGM